MIFFNMAENNDTLIESSLKFLEKIKSNLKDPGIEIIAEQGDFASVILDVAITRTSFDIIVARHA